MAGHDDPPSPPARNNAAGRCRWWGAPGRTLASVLAHIEAGNSTVLGFRRRRRRRFGTPFFNFSLSFHLAEFKYITNSPIYV
jgi:hypothetical protein